MGHANQSRGLCQKGTRGTRKLLVLSPGVQVQFEGRHRISLNVAINPLVTLVVAASVAKLVEVAGP